ncbi:MAG: hypothetical protein ACOH19_01720 [Rhodoglobus sp.]
MKVIRYGVSFIALLAVTGALLVGGALPASADDYGGYGGYDGNPVNCTGNFTVGAAVPVNASDGRVVGYSQMWWSNSCQANWTRAWTVDGSSTWMESDIYQSRPPGPTRRFATAVDTYTSYHFTMYIRAGATETMCGSTKMWDARTANWAFSGVYCRS